MTNETTNTNATETTPDPHQMIDPDAQAETQQYERMEQQLQAQLDRGEITLPDHFQGDPKKFVQSYREMQKAYTQSCQAATAQENPTPSQPVTPPADAPVTPPATSEGTPAAPPADTTADWADLTAAQQEQVKQGANLEAVWPELNKQLTSQGQITPDFAKENGLPDDMVAMLNTSFAAKRDADRRAAAERVGGEKNLNTILDWAKRNLPESERVQMTEQLHSQNWAIALDALAHRFKNNQAVPNQINNSGAGGPVAAVWASPAERAAAYRDPRYRVDPNFRRQVYAREVASLQK